MLPAGCGLLSCLRRDKGEAAGRTDPRVADEPASSSPSLGKGKGGSGAAARRFAWAEIESVTAGFSSRVIGQGGFSTVYLACLSSSRLGAVKVQRSSERLHRAFRQELDVLLSLRHPHIVRLLGYCDEREEGVLVFEYAPNGDLHERLHGRGGKATPTLPWARRMAVAFQVAMALEHLHESRDPAVIHGDIKASNVLLDASLDAKLCDFGFAHVGFSAALQPPSTSASAARPVMMGSPGYVDPHFLRSGVATKKSDVYSFGVLLLELLTGREAMCADTGRRLAATVGPTLSGKGGGKVDDVVDRRLGDAYDTHEAATVAALALRCVSEGPGMRPSMAEVVRELQEKTTALISAAGCKPPGKMDSCS